MTAKRHGISIGIHRVDSEFFLYLKVTGKLTHEDYQAITPMIESALSGISSPSIKALVVCNDFQGWELRAAWDDFKLGLKHGKEFTRVAIVGDKPWEKAAAKVGSWFIGGEMRFFEDVQLAQQWLEV